MGINDSAIQDTMFGSHLARNNTVATQDSWCMCTCNCAGSDDRAANAQLTQAAAAISSPMS